VITNEEHLHPDFEDLDREEIDHAEAIMSMLIAFFGPLPPELVAHVNDEIWGEKMNLFSERIKAMGMDWRFENWKPEEYPELDPDTKRVLSSMLSLDPAKRATMEEIMAEGLVLIRLATRHPCTRCLAHNTG
jgi:serine/threonine protein kinase